MWHVLEYKLPKKRKWNFHSASGDKAMMEGIAKELVELGYEVELTESENVVGAH